MANGTPPNLDEVDRRVVGAGAAGMAAAQVGAIEGLRSVLRGKIEMVGSAEQESQGRESAG